MEVHEIEKLPFRMISKNPVKVIMEIYKTVTLDDPRQLTSNTNDWAQVDFCDNATSPRLASIKRASYYHNKTSARFILIVNCRMTLVGLRKMINQ